MTSTEKRANEAENVLMDEERAYKEEVGRRIVQARREFPTGQITQKELAELIHVSERSMQAYEAGEVVPYRKVAEIASVLNVSMAWILHGEKAQKDNGDLAPLLQGIMDKLDRLIQVTEAKAA